MKLRPILRSLTTTSLLLLPLSGCGDAGDGDADAEDGTSDADETGTPESSSSGDGDADAGDGDSGDGDSGDGDSGDGDGDSGDGDSGDGDSGDGDSGDGDSGDGDGDSGDGDGAVCDGWMHQLGSDQVDNGYAVALDSQGNLYVAGQTTGGIDGEISAGNADAFVTKYALDGTKEWTQQFGTGSLDRAYGIAVDSQDNVLVTGLTQGQLGTSSFGDRDIFVTKMLPNGTEIWTQQIGTPAWDQGNAIAVDSQDNVIVTGFTQAQMGPGGGVVILKLDSAGDQVFLEQTGGSLSDEGRAVAVDSNDNIYVAMWLTGGIDGGTPSGGYDAAVVKYSPGGTLQWGRQQGSNVGDFPYAIAVGSDDTIYVAGRTQGDMFGSSAGDDDIFVMSYDSEGNAGWTDQFGTAVTDEARGLAVDGAGNVIVTGYTGGLLEGQDSDGLEDAFVTKFSDAGSKLWTEQIGSDGDEWGQAVAVDGDDLIYAVGWTNGLIEGAAGGGGGYDMWVSRVCSPN